MQNEVSNDKSLKTVWYNKKLAFWSITFIISAIIIVLFSKFVVPAIFGDNYYVSKNADFLDKLCAFLSRLMPYVVGICGSTSYLIYNVKHRDSIFTIKTYIMSIISTCIGLIISTLLLFIISFSFFALLVLIGLFIVINILTGFGFTSRRTK